MYDFSDVLWSARMLRLRRNYALAAYYYWEIGYAYQDEEFPYGYTDRIGSSAYRGLRRCMRHVTSDTLRKSKDYQEIRAFLMECKPHYVRAFERYVKYYRPKRRRCRKQCWRMAKELAIELTKYCWARIARKKMNKNVRKCLSDRNFFINFASVKQVRPNGRPVD